MSDPSTKEAATSDPGGTSQDEFAHIPAPRTRHPALAIGAIALAVFLIVHQRADIGYALAGGTPRDLGDARALFGAGAAPPANSYVTISGTPDRESALHVDTQGSWEFSQLFRILGTGSRLLVHRMRGDLPTERAVRDVFTGRLVRLGQLPYDASIRRHYADHVSATHFFPPSDLLAALGSDAATLKDSVGEMVKIGPAEILAIDVLRPGHFEVSIPRERIAAPDAARAEIEKRGGKVIGPAKGGPVTAHSFVVEVPEAVRDRVLGAVADIDRRSWIRPARDQYRVRLPELRQVDGDLAIRSAGNNEVRVRPADIASVRTLDSVKIPEDAYVLLEADEPRQHLPAVIVSLALLGFATVNLLGLRQGLRRG